MTPVPDRSRPAGDLVDGRGRRVSYLRLSLTERCNFTCSYCSPAARDRVPSPLSREEVRRLVTAFAGLGVRRVRLTGGEPTLRGDLLDVARDVRAVPGIEEVALTTNGHRLAELARPLRLAGVTRLNVSLDTLRPERLRALAGRGASLDRVTRGLAEAARSGFGSLKLNTVMLRGRNTDELGDLARFAWRHGGVARFIELMPFGVGAREAPVSVAEAKRLLEAQGVRLEPDAMRGWGPAYHMRGRSGGSGETLSGLVGFIGAMTESFCDGCNRVRVGPDGALRPCLGGRDEVPLRDLLRDGGEEALAARVRAALAGKADRHRMAEGGPLLPMARIGG